MKIAKRGNLSDQVWIMAGNTVPRGRQIRIVVPAICIHIIPAMTPTGQAVPDHDDKRRFSNHLMTGSAEAIYDNSIRQMVSVCQAITVAPPAVRFF